MMVVRIGHRRFPSRPARGATTRIRLVTLAVARYSTVDTRRRAHHRVTGENNSFVSLMSVYFSPVSALRGVERCRHGRADLPIAPLRRCRYARWRSLFRGFRYARYSTSTTPTAGVERWRRLASSWWSSRALQRPYRDPPAVAPVVERPRWSVRSLRDRIETQYREPPSRLTPIETQCASGSIPVRRPDSSPAIAARSAASSSKSNTLKFSTMRLAVTDFGITTLPS
jgi:hypothetical protein